MIPTAVSSQPLKGSSQVVLEHSKTYEMLIVSIVFVFVLQKHNFPINYAIRVHSYEVFKLANISRMVKVLTLNVVLDGDVKFVMLSVMLLHVKDQQNLINPFITFLFSPQPTRGYGWKAWFSRGCGSRSTKVC